MRAPVCRSVFAAVMVLSSPGAEALAGPRAKSVVIERDAETLTTRITLEAYNGRIAWADVLAGLARAKGYDDSAFADLLPDTTFRLDHSYSEWAVELGNQVLPGGISLERQRADVPGAEPKLIITLDRAALLASKRQLQKAFREKAARTLSFLGAGKPRNFGIRLDDGIAKAAPDTPLVLVVPGYQAAPVSTDSLVQHFRKLGHPVGSFSYPNDQPLEDSAALLARELRNFKKDQSRRPVRIVALSMGGLVVRRLIEDPALDPGNVRQLIMVATPNQGTRLAGLGFLLEWWEHVVESNERGYFHKFYASLEDGLNEAATDLKPNSIFLKELNARPRSPNVRYSVILGTDAFLSEECVERMRTALNAQAENHRVLRFLRPRLDAWLSDLDEMVRDKGDGAVALSRGRLEGVSDVIHLPFNHIGINRHPRNHVERRLLEEIARRLRQPVR